jgi:hypothetical protein
MTDKRPAGTKRKRRGGGVVFTLIILILAAGAVFYFGLVSFQLEEGEYAVLFTKTHGYEPEPLESGAFTWRWQALLPTNMTLHTFSLETRTVPIRRSGNLMSAELYGSLIPEEPDFSWNIDLDIVYRLLPEALPELVADGLLADGLEDWYTRFESRIVAETDEIMQQIVSVDDPEDLMNPVALGEHVREILAESREESEIISVGIRRVSIPDMALYAQARVLYFQLMEAREQAIAVAETEAIAKADEAESRLRVLENYGRILTEYPVLIDFFSLEGNPGAPLLPQEE